MVHENSIVIRRGSPCFLQNQDKQLQDQRYQIDMFQSISLSLSKCLAGIMQH